ncbi:MAG: ABC transporter substrate-binding protein [bacterium]|jgi:branched-chain amino acid transport system substrate-binding protein
MRKCVYGLISVVLAALLAGCNPPPAEDEGGGADGTAKLHGDAEGIKIGVNLELTGDTATFGQSCLNGIKLALEEMGPKPVLGKDIILIQDDNQGKGTDAANAAKKQVDIDKVPLMIGAVASTNSIAISAIAEDKHVPQVTPASTRTDLTLAGDGTTKKYTFRTCFIDDFQGDAIAKFCREDLKAERIAILYDNGSDYSKGIYERVKKTFAELGGTIAAERTYDAKVDNDFRAHLSQIHASKFDVLVVPGYYSEVGKIASQAREIGITQTIVGGDGFDSPKLVEIAGDAIEGAFFTTHFSADDPNPTVQAFVSKYKARYNAVPDAMAVLGYDAMNLCADAIKRAGAADPEAITKALGETKNFPGVTGNITINDKHNAVKDVVVLQVKEGKFAMYKTIPAESPAPAATDSNEPVEMSDAAEQGESHGA